MEIFKRSFLLQKADGLWSAIVDKFRGGAVHGAVMWLWRIFQASFFYSFVVSPSRLDRRLEESAVVRAVLWCLNLVPNLLHRLYLKNKKLFDGSLFIAISDWGALAVLCVMLTVMLVTPQKRWNNMYSLALSLAAVFMFWISGMRRADRRFGARGIGAWMVIYAVFVFASAFWSQTFSYSARFIFFAFTCVMVVLMMTNCVENEKQLMAVVGCIAAGLFISSVYALYQRINGVEASASFTDLTLNSLMPGRVFSFFENPNSYANLLVLFIPLMITMFFCVEKPLPKLALLAVVGTSCLALMMTYSRAGWLSLAFAVFVLMLIVCPRYTPLLIAAGVLALPLLPESIINRLMTIFMGDSSISTRAYIYSGALGIIAASPLLGAGLGAKAVRNAAYLTGEYNLPRVPYVHAHNIYLEVWAESGVFALIAFVLAVLYLIQNGARRARDKRLSLKLRAVCAGCASGLAGSALFGMTDFAWGYPRVMVIYWSLVAILCTAIKLSGKENEKAG